ncbi:MAG: FAD-binding protein, partial [Candidatus Brocadiaceae bacterium]
MASFRRVEIGGLTLPVYSLNTVVVGSGAAGLACAARLVQEMAKCGVSEPASRVAVLTEGVGTGTSHNAGSDKQTYYKLGTHPSEPDTPRKFAETLTAAGCAHGDLALVEALNSLRCFHYLVEIGVPFPHDEHGGFVGYKTDFDPCQRATSAGPWTSRLMVRRLLAEVSRAGVQVFDRHYMLGLVRPGSGEDGAVCGLLCCDVTRQRTEDRGLVLFNCLN